MRRFFEEYSGVLVVIIVAIVLIAICMGLKVAFSDSMTDLANKFTNKAQEILDYDEGSEEGTILLPGLDFNMALKKLVNPDAVVNDSGYPSSDTTITSILFDKDYEKPASDYVELQESGEPVYAWLDPDGETIKITSKADKIYANSDSIFMFSYFNGQEGIPFVLDTNWLNTSKVTNMFRMFCALGRGASSVSLDLSNWDTSNVTDMSYMFNVLGTNASSVSLDLSSWNTSNVTNMSSMFHDCGRNATALTLTGLSNWNTSNVTDMTKTFYYCGELASSVLLDLSGWNTSNVTNMSAMFTYCGNKSTSFFLDISGWDASNVTDMGGALNNMFTYCGKNATSWTVKIPAKTGELDNTTTKFYGKTVDVYGTQNFTNPKEFTLVG